MVLIKKIISTNSQNYCELFRKPCLKEECGAFTHEVPVSDEEKANLLGDSVKEGMYCLRFGKVLIPEYRRNDKGNLVRTF